MTTEKLLALIGEYWEIAYAEGVAGATHDDQDGSAQRAWSEITAAVAALAQQPAAVAQDKPTQEEWASLREEPPTEEPSEQEIAAEALAISAALERADPDLPEFLASRKAGQEAVAAEPPATAQGAPNALEMYTTWMGISKPAAPPAAAPGEVERTQAAIDVLAERCRQIEREGWTPEHDDEHDGMEMAFAASCYTVANAGEAPPAVWPWEWSWWKPRDHRSNLVRAGALIIAEIERLDRAAAKGKA